MQLFPSDRVYHCALLLGRTNGWCLRARDGESSSMIARLKRPTSVISPWDSLTGPLSSRLVRILCPLPGFTIGDSEIVVGESPLGPFSHKRKMPDLLYARTDSMRSTCAALLALMELAAKFII